MQETAPQDEYNAAKEGEINPDSLIPLSSISNAISATTKNDSQRIEKLEKGLKWLEPLLHRPNLLKIFLGLSLEASATSIGNSKSIDSAENSAATSNAAVNVSRHLNNILQDAPPHVTNELGFMRYISKLDEMPLSRLDESDVRPFGGSQASWQLIQLAVTFSALAYDKKPEKSRGSITFQGKGDFKASIVCHKEVHGRSMLIVAIRGTASLDDWMLNFNGAPQASTDLLQGSFEWHTGFMRSAMAMEQQISKAISSLRRQQESIDTILFTGHSAGGAIAQIFYAMSFSKDTGLSRTLSGVNKIHCITFGAPPTANFPMHALAESSLFLSILNEGDPVALAQEDYFKALISVYVLSPEALATKYPNGFAVPSPILRVSGICLVLRDSDPDDMDEDGFDAVEVAAQDVEKKLFGYPFVHLMSVYSARVEQLAAQSLRDVDVMDKDFATTPVSIF